jgi:hypothetical protein
MLSIAELEILLKARDEASRVLDKADKNLKTYAGNIEKFARPALLGLTAATSLLIGATAVFVHAAAEGEVASASLEAAIRATGIAFDESGAAEVDAFVRSLANFSGFSTNEVKTALAILVIETGDVEEAMNRERIAVDFARGAHLDLVTASKLLGKITDDTINVLARYGIHVDKNTTSTELFALITQKFAGQAAAYADTLEGKWGKVQNRFSDLTEDVGKLLIPVIDRLLDAAERAEVGLAKMEPDIAKWLSHNSEVVAFGVAIAGVVVAIAGLAIVGGLLASPIVAFALLAAALYAVYSNVQLVIDNWDKMGEALRRGDLTKVVDDMGKLIGPLGLVASLWIRVAQGIQSAIDAWKVWQALTGVTVGGGGGGPPPPPPPGGGPPPPPPPPPPPGGGGGGGGGGGPIEPGEQGPEDFAAGGQMVLTEPTALFGLQSRRLLATAAMHGSEPVSFGGEGGRAGGGDTYVFHFGNVYGVDDLREQVIEAVREAKRRGGFRGVFDDAA